MILFVASQEDGAAMEIRTARMEPMKKNVVSISSSRDLCSKLMLSVL